MIGAIASVLFELNIRPRDYGRNLYSIQFAYHSRADLR
jgi:hypothetical protein